jgi:hypothetical protein
MKTEKDLNFDIINITMTIEKVFPELSKYISEIWVTKPHTLNTEISTKNLKDYYEILESFLSQYAASHAGLPAASEE